MMKKNRIEIRNAFWLAGFCFLMTAAIVSCSKTNRGGGSNNDDHEFNPADTDPPVITIDRPLADQVFTNSDTIKVEGRVTDLGLYRGSIKITNDATGGLINEQLYEIHGLPSYNFSFKHKATVAAIANYTVTVQFEDHGLNITTQTRKVKINP